MKKTVERVIKKQLKKVAKKKTTRKIVKKAPKKKITKRAKKAKVAQLAMPSIIDKPVDMPNTEAN